MKLRDLILLTLFFPMGSHPISSQSQKGNLPIINISKKHTQKEICLQDIADIEYIPLDTTDDILLSGQAVLSYVSDNIS